MDYLFTIPDSFELEKFGIRKKIVMSTTKPRAYERIGFTKSKHITMEIEHELVKESQSK
jgi:hypothetical protein